MTKDELDTLKIVSEAEILSGFAVKQAIKILARKAIADEENDAEMWSGQFKGTKANE